MKDILFLDIETVPVASCMEDMPEPLQEVWEHKFKSLKKAGMYKEKDEDYSAEEAFVEGAGVYAEFAKVVCVSVGFIYDKNGDRCLRIKSFYGDDERKVLEEFVGLVKKFMTTARHKVCGHNVKEFDLPFISRRLLINGMRIPDAINAAGKKPWETNFLDTMEMWKFGDFKSYTSLKTLAAVFGIPSPKDDIDGSEVAGVYYNTGDVERIARYCEKDVKATVQVWLRLNGWEILDDSNIEFV